MSLMVEPFPIENRSWVSFGEQASELPVFKGCLIILKVRGKSRQMMRSPTLNGKSSPSVFHSVEETGEEKPILLSRSLGRSNPNAARYAVNGMVAAYTRIESASFGGTRSVEDKIPRKANKIIHERDRFGLSKVVPIP